MRSVQRAGHPRAGGWPTCTKGLPPKHRICTDRTHSTIVSIRMMLDSERWGHGSEFPVFSTGWDRNKMHRQIGEEIICNQFRTQRDAFALAKHNMCSAPIMLPWPQNVQYMCHGQVGQCQVEAQPYLWNVCQQYWNNKTIAYMRIRKTTDLSKQHLIANMIVIQCLKGWTTWVHDAKQLQPHLQNNFAPQHVCVAGCWILASETFDWAGEGACVLHPHHQGTRFAARVNSLHYKKLSWELVWTGNNSLGCSWALWTRRHRGLEKIWHISLLESWISVRKWV